MMESVKNWIQTQSDPHTLYVSIERNLPKIKASGFRQGAFENVAEPMQQRIKALLNG
jgi:hypothetical protein